MYRRHFLLTIVVAMAATSCAAPTASVAPTTSSAPVGRSSSTTVPPDSTTTSTAVSPTPYSVALEQWSSASPPDYVFVINRGCVECDQSLVGSFRITVRNREAVMVEQMPMQERAFFDNPPTIDSLFSDIGAWLDSHPEANARFDPQLGFPLEAELGEEDSIVIEYVEFDLLGQQAELEAARRLWDEKGYSDYLLTWERRCFCDLAEIGPFETTVENGLATGSRWTGDQQGRDPAEFPETVATLFDTIDRYLAMHPVRLDVEYDSELGYPIEMFADIDLRMADEEYGFAVTDLTPSA